MTDKYRPATNEDLARLAKTGCAACHGAGRYSTPSGKYNLCRCVLKKHLDELAIAKDKQVMIRVGDTTPPAAAFFGSWRDYKDFRDDWFPSHWDEIHLPPEDFPPPEAILFASYGGQSYEGDAYVLFRKDAKYFEVHGSHCSCTGLEDQWDPAKVSVPYLVNMVKAMRNAEDPSRFLEDHEEGARAAFVRLVGTLARLEGVEP